MEKNLFSTEGRIRRTSFWLRFFVSFMFILFVQIFISINRLSPSIFYIILNIFFSIFMLIQGAKRMHDVEKSGFYYLIPIYNLILCFTEGTRGNNKYGEDPKTNNNDGDIIYNGIMTLLLSALLSCIGYAILNETKITEEIKEFIFFGGFTILVILFVIWNPNSVKELED